MPPVKRNHANNLVNFYCQLYKYRPRAPSYFCAKKNPMLYSFERNPAQPTVKLPLLKGMRVYKTNDAKLLSSLMNLPVDNIELRLATGHTAYIADYEGLPAAFGWLARISAHIGELNHEFNLQEGDGYLWNFRTLESFRGKGIYPRLLQAIMQNEAEINRFWILHAPENRASETGIKKAGFLLEGMISVVDEIIHLHPLNNGATATQALSLPLTKEVPVCCWNCHSPYLTKRQESCCCSPLKACSNKKFINTTVSATESSKTPALA